MKNLENTSIGESNKKNFWLQIQKFFRVLEKIGEKRHLKAMRLTFTTLVPILIIGSISLLISQFLFGASGQEQFSVIGLICHLCGNSWDKVDNLISSSSTSWYKSQQLLSSVFSIINTATIGIISIYFVFLYGYYISKLKGTDERNNTIIIGFVSLASFVISIMGQLNYFMGVNGLFSALITGALSVEFFLWLVSKSTFTFNATKSDNTLIRYFSYIIPLALTLLAISCINIAFLVVADCLPNVLELQSLSYGSNKYDIWFNSPTNQITYNDFIEFAKSKYNVSEQSLTKLNPTESNWTNLFDEFGTNQISISDWLDNFNHDSTETGRKIFAIYIFKKNEPILLGSGDLDISSLNNIDNLTVIYNKYSSLALEKSELFISITNVLITIPHTSFGLSAGIFYIFNGSLSFIGKYNGNFGLAFTYIFLISVFWFFGIHGSNITASIFETIWWNGLINNTNQKNIGNSLNTNDNSNLNIFTKPFFDSYVNIGGVGGTLCLLICLLCFSKRKEVKKISKYSVAPALFNINETVVFGIPIVLNGVYFIPFILAPITAMIIGYMATGPLHLVSVAYTSAPWSMPWIIQAFIVTGDYRAVILALFIFICVIFVWLPFVILDNKLYFENLKVTNPKEYNEKMRFIHDYEYRQNILEEQQKEKILNLERIKLERERRKFERRIKKNSQNQQKFMKKAKMVVDIKEKDSSSKNDNDDEAGR